MRSWRKFLLAVVVSFCSLAHAADDMLVYYGYLNSFNSSSNSWDNDLVVADIGSNYKVVVFGDGVANPSHPDFANSSYIIDQLRVGYPGIKIFGYVTANQSLQDFQRKASQWDTLKAHGIFFDEAGYDYGKTRQELNQRIQFVRELNFAKVAFVNAWKPDHVLGLEEDASYPNATYNPSLDQSLLGSIDYYMLESFVYVQATPGYETLAQYLDRGDRVKLLAQTFPIKISSVAIIDNADVNGQKKFDRFYKGSHLFGLDLIGSSDLSYGASSAKVDFWARPSISHL